MKKTAWLATFTGVGLAALAALVAFPGGTRDLTAGAPTADDSAVAVSAATATPTVTPALIPPAVAFPLYKGWNYYCHLDIEKPVEDVADDISGPVDMIFRMAPGGSFQRWIPDAPEASTIATVASNEALFILMAEEGSWGQIMAGPWPSSLTLLPGWNAVCPRSDAPLDDSTTGIANHIGIIYQMAPDQIWRRFVPDRPEVSTLDQPRQATPLLVLVTGESAVQWELQR